MPIYKTITVSDSTQVYIWKVTESENELAQNISLTDNSLKRMSRMKSESHRRAFLSIRHLFIEAGFEDKEVYYNEFGKPFLYDGRYISITHSNEFTAIIVSEAIKVGIDVEKQRDKILRIAYKFTTFEAYRTLANSEATIRKLTIIWGAKESLYKIYGQQGLSFFKHIDVHDFSFEDTKTTAQITYQSQKSNYDVTYLEFEGFTCVYALRLEDSI